MTETALERYTRGVPPPTPRFGDYTHAREREVFLWCLHTGEGGWDSFNTKSGAYGRWQVMPTNWRNWGSKYLGIPIEECVAGPDIPLTEWVPAATQENQVAIVGGRIDQFHRNMSVDFPAREVWTRVAAAWCCGGGAARAPFVEWARHPYIYATKLIWEMQALLKGDAVIGGN